MRYANAGESVIPPTAPDLSERDLEYVETIGNYENLQHDEVCVFKYKVADDTTRVGILLNDATGYNMADFWVYCATGATITVTHADGTVLTHLGTNAYHNFNHDYTGWTAFETGYIVIDTDSGQGSYYFAELMSTVGGAENDIMQAVQYVYVSDYINNMPNNFCKYTLGNYIVTSNNTGLVNMGSDSFRDSTYINIVLPYVHTIGDRFLRNSKSIDNIFMPNLVVLSIESLRTSYPKYVCFGQVTTIENLVLEFDLLNVEVVRFNTILPPTVSSATFLQNLSKSAIVSLDSGADLTTWQTATNLTHLADQMVKRSV